MIQEIAGGVTAPKGYKATGIEVGIKEGHAGKKDMAMIYCEVPCRAAATFTTNLVKAAPVQFDRQIIESGNDVQAVVINSGIANACTGEEGMACCREMSRSTTEALQIPVDRVLVASTGVIGEQLPVQRIVEGIHRMVPELGNSLADGTLAAEAIMTTDTHSKEVAVTTTIGGHTVTIGGMCKGSGMIHINMCTMLGFLTTDAAISKEMLQKALSEDIPDTFNMVSIDGDTSTNDTVLLLANGLAENDQITEDGEDYQTFVQALHKVTTFLAKQIAGDGEGCTALLEVKVIHAETKEQAVKISKSIAASSLVKSMIFGHDANWGRIMCAMGYSGAAFHPEIVDIYFESAAGKVKMAENGLAVDYSEEKATQILSEPEVTAIVDLKEGQADATAWGCDLTYEYVKINADYRS